MMSKSEAATEALDFVMKHEIEPISKRGGRNVYSTWDIPGETREAVEHVTCRDEFTLNDLATALANPEDVHETYQTKTA